MQSIASESDVVAAVNVHGFAIVPDVLSVTETDRLIAILDDAAQREGIARRGGILAVRNLLEAVPAIGELAKSPTIRALVELILGPDCFAVRGIFFDKTPQTNWKVSWHQDLTIAVEERFSVPGFGPWSEKAGVQSVQPPARVLDEMITLRVNLDDCSEDNGPVRVLPGSHVHGRLSTEEISAWRSRVPEVATVASRGAALVMRPLLLHASSPARRPGRRRVIHIDYAASDLPGGLRWNTRV